MSVDGDRCIVIAISSDRKIYSAKKKKKKKKKKSLK